MLKHRSLAATAATFFFLLAGVASADVAGSYKLAIGSATPCAVTLAADGTASGDCFSVAKWNPTPSGINLLTAGGTLYAVLKTKGDTFDGYRVNDQRKLTLSH